MEMNGIQGDMAGFKKPDWDNFGGLGVSASQGRAEAPPSLTIDGSNSPSIFGNGYD